MDREGDPRQAAVSTTDVADGVLWIDVAYGTASGRSSFQRRQSSRSRTRSGWQAARGTAPSTE